MEAGSGTPDESQERINILNRQIKQTREKMELETHTFIEAAKDFTSEWIRQEVEKTECSRNEIEDKKDYREEKTHLEEKSNREEKKQQEKSEERKPDPGEQIARIPSIVEEYLNRDEYWIHRNELFQSNISQSNISLPKITPDDLEFKKEKTRKQLTTCIRMLLGCSAELLSDRGYAQSEDKIWAKERGRRKYVCIFRLSGKMEASLSRYFSMLEELHSLEYKLKFYEQESRA